MMVADASSGPKEAGRARGHLETGRLTGREKPQEAPKTPLGWMVKSSVSSETHRALLQARV